MRKILAFTIFCSLILLSCKSSKRSNLSFDSYISKYRIEYKSHFNTEPGSPLKGKDLELMQFYPPDKNYHIIADFKKNINTRLTEIPTYSGIKKEFIIYGALSFKIKNKTYHLNVYRSLRTMQMPQYKDHLFVPFKDYTNGDDTYGGGRYLDIKTTDIRINRVVIDFNKSYNPYCAYANGYNCPIPPKENHLETYLLAGEKMYTGERRERSQH